MNPTDRNAVIFGVNGQDGRYLSELLRAKRVKVIGVSRHEGCTITGDVADFQFVRKVIQEIRPDYVFHLAAESTTDHDALFRNHRAIGTGSLNILESVRLHASGSKVFLSGSGLQFANDGHPINESTPFEAKSPYAVARIQSTYAGRYFRSAFGLRVYFGYLFNHDSPLRSERHINQKIARACIRISAGSKEKLNIQDLGFRKEFNHAFDVVQGIWKLVNQEEITEAVIGCGRAHTIREWVEACFDIVGLDWRKFVTEGTGSSEACKTLVSDPTLILGLGWKPRYDLKGLALDMMNSSGQVE
jgi:GDPmannose 4,6-dehydratase